MSSPYRFAIAALDKRELQQTSALLQTVFPHALHLTPAHLGWLYTANPDGPAIACNAWHGSELVGHMAGVPFCARYCGEDLRGMYLMNGSIHPEHRRRRLQSTISETMFEHAVGQGLAFCTATGNRASTGPLLTRFQLLGPLDARVGFGLPKRKHDRPEPAFQSITDRGKLEWRLANPQREYSVRNGAVYAPAGPGLSALLIDGADLPDRGPAPAGPLRLSIGLDPSVDWGQSAYVRIPNRLRPSPLNLVWRDLAGRAPRPDLKAMTLRAVDFDFY